MFLAVLPKNRHSYCPASHVSTRTEPGQRLLCDFSQIKQENREFFHQRACRGVLREHEVSCPLIRAIHSQYNQHQSLVWITGSRSDSFPVRVGVCHGCPLSPLVFKTLMKTISRLSHGVEGDGLVTSGLMMWSCWLQQSMTSNFHWISSQPSVKRLRCESAPSTLRPCRSVGKRCSTFSWSGRRSCPKWKSSSTSGSCLRVREQWSGSRKLISASMTCCG